MGQKPAKASHLELSPFLEPELRVDSPPSSFSRAFALGRRRARPCLRRPVLAKRSVAPGALIASASSDRVL